MLRKRFWPLTAVVIVIVFGALAGAALLFWPQAHLGRDDAALTRIVLPGFGGRVSAVEVSSATTGLVAVALRHGELWPLHQVAAGERLTVIVTVRRPGWVGWLVGHTQRRSFTLVTPSAHLLGRWLQVTPGSPVTVAFDRPVVLVSFRGSSTRLSKPLAAVPVGVVVQGSYLSGSVTVAAAARSWERLPDPVRVSWFPARTYPQLLVDPNPTAKLAPAGRLTLTFSEPIADVLGSARPRVSPATPGHWLTLDAHTLAFQPSGLGFPFGEQVRLTLPVAVHLAGRPGAGLTRRLTWQVPQGSTLRLQQLLAELGYLALAWQPSRPVATSLAAQLTAAVSPPAGQFSWRYPQLRAMLGSLWQPGQYSVLVQGAVLAFEADHGLSTDGVVDGQVWADLLRAAVRRQVDRQPYDYIEVSKASPETLSVWRRGRIVYTTPCNTGIAARPTADGTFPVYARYLSTTMSGTNPDGSPYSDPGVPYVAYFNGGDAVHGFLRGGYGYPQSLGCVELPYSAASVVFTYDPIGTLVGVS
jgi:peptidoglycan hydrolase-like protein with peptidoglycan-binding domain